MNNKLTLTGQITYQAEVDSFLAAKVIALVEQNNMQVTENNSATPADFISAGVDAPRRRFAGRSLIQAFEETGAKSKPQKLVVAGSRAMEESEEESFTSRQVIEQFKSAGISAKNLDRDLKKAISSGLIFLETGKKGNYKVTELAIAAFDKGFNEVKLPVGRIASRAKNSRGPVKLSISEEVQALDIEVSMPGFPNYHDIEKKGDRIIWLLIFAAKNGIQGLNSKEIQCISHELRDQIDVNSVSALTKSAIKRGLIARSGYTYRLLHAGEELIKGQLDDQGRA